uniref:Uncharacterized protein n=1 Tax=Rhizophora mucronata TaxID=61149 RepID=A0A2P2NZ09_RHIMU
MAGSAFKTLVPEKWRLSPQLNLSVAMSLFSPVEFFLLSRLFNS